LLVDWFILCVHLVCFILHRNYIIVAYIRSKAIER